MKLLFLLFFSLIASVISASAQSNEKPSLPKAEDIERVEISPTNAVNWYKPEELIKLLPQFVSAEGTYGTKAVPFQRGKFILKNGKEIAWMANHDDSILLLDGSQERLFVLPKKDEAIFRVWDKDGNEGYIYRNGKPANLIVRNAVGDFSEGLAPALVGDKWGYIDRRGDLVIAPRWKNNDGWLPPVSPFHEGLAAVIEYASWGVRDDSNYWTYKCGYINTKGEYVIQPKLRQSCGPFFDGMARIEVDFDDPEYEKEKGWIGFLDRQGNWAIKPQFFYATNFSDGASLVQSDPRPQDLYIKIPGTDLVRENYNRQSLYLVDKIGRRIPNKKDCRWRHSFREGLALIFSDSNHGSVIDEQCEEVFRLAPDLKYDAIYFTANGYDGSGKYGNSTYFSEGLLLVYKEVGGEKLFGYLDQSGKTAIDFKFTDATPFFDGLAGVVVKEKDKSYNAYINAKGEVVLKNISGIAPFYNGLAFHYLFAWTICQRPGERNIYGYMNKQGKYVWLSPRFETYLDKDWIKANYVGETR